MAHIIKPERDILPCFMGEVFKAPYYRQREVNNLVVQATRCTEAYHCSRATSKKGMNAAEKYDAVKREVFLVRAADKLLHQARRLCINPIRYC